MTTMRGLLLITMLLVFVTGCKKPVEDPVNPSEPQMPSPTEVGNNILACKINEKIYVYQGKYTNSSPDGVSFHNYYSALSGKFTSVHADNSEYGNSITMNVYEWDIQTQKEYKFSLKESQDVAQYYFGSGHKDNTYTTADGSGFIKFSRYDSLVVAGVFQFTGYNPLGDKVEITEGFFDISRR